MCVEHMHATVLKRAWCKLLLSMDNSLILMCVQQEIQDFFFFFFQKTFPRLTFIITCIKFLGLRCVSFPRVDISVVFCK